VGRSLHADETAEHGAERPADEGQRGVEAEARRQDDEEKDQHDEAGEDRVFALEKRHGAGMDRLGDLLHNVIADRLGLDDVVDGDGDYEPRHPENRC
jgi:hypothetical protein